MSLYQYDPGQIIASFIVPGFAVEILDGAINGPFLTMAQDAPQWSRDFDNYGNSIRVKSSNGGGRLTIALSASSPTNTVLSQIALLDSVSENLVGTLGLADLNGVTLFHADGVFLEGIPDISFGKDRGQRAWIFHYSNMNKLLTGHKKIG